VLILLAASAISAWMGEDVDAGIIITIILMSVCVSFWQSYRSQQAAERLRASVAPTATVCRDGVWRVCPIREVVPGDAIRLSAGDLVPADARLLDSRDLAVQQSMLTGESLPADKRVSLGEDATSGSPDSQVVVKQLPAMQNLGSIDILCCDKTGTLTTGVMRFDASVGPTGTPSPRVLTLALLNSRFQTGIRSPLDAAILELASPEASQAAKVDEIPFDFERRRLSVVVSTENSGAHLLITKAHQSRYSTSAKRSKSTAALSPSTRRPGPRRWRPTTG
jgi:magnesium-transporting ATPase (P-type)